MSTVREAAQTGDERATLVALRDSLAGAIDDAEPHMRAPLAGRLLDVLAALADLEAPEVSAKDDLRRKRDERRAAQRVAGSEVPQPAGGRGGKRGAGGGGSGGKRGAGSAPVAGAGA